MWLIHLILRILKHQNTKECVDNPEYEAHRTDDNGHDGVVCLDLTTFLRLRVVGSNP